MDDRHQPIENLETAGSELEDLGRYPEICFGYVVEIRQKRIPMELCVNGSARERPHHAELVVDVELAFERAAVDGRVAEALQHAERSRGVSTADQQIVVHHCPSIDRAEQSKRQRNPFENDEIDRRAFEGIEDPRELFLQEEVSHDDRGGRAHPAHLNQLTTVQRSPRFTGATPWMTV